MENGKSTFKIDWFGIRFVFILYILCIKNINRPKYLYLRKPIQYKIIYIKSNQKRFYIEINFLQELLEILRYHKYQAMTSLTIRFIQYLVAIDAEKPSSFALNGILNSYF